MRAWLAAARGDGEKERRVSARAHTFELEMEDRFTDSKRRLLACFAPPPFGNHDAPQTASSSAMLLAGRLRLLERADGQTRERERESRARDAAGEQRQQEQSQQEDDQEAEVAARLNLLRQPG